MKETGLSAKITTAQAGGRPVRAPQPQHREHGDEIGEDAGEAEEQGKLQAGPLLEPPRKRDVFADERRVVEHRRRAIHREQAAVGDLLAEDVKEERVGRADGRGGAVKFRRERDDGVDENQEAQRAATFCGGRSRQHEAATELECAGVFKHDAVARRAAADVIEGVIHARHREGLDDRRDVVARAEIEHRGGGRRTAERRAPRRLSAGR